MGVRTCCTSWLWRLVSWILPDYSFYLILPSCCQPLLGTWILCRLCLPAWFLPFFFLKSCLLCAIPVTNSMYLHISSLSAAWRSSLSDHWPVSRELVVRSKKHKSKVAVVTPFLPYLSWGETGRYDIWTQSLLKQNFILYVLNWKDDTACAPKPDIL